MCDLSLKYLKSSNTISNMLLNDSVQVLSDILTELGTVAGVSCACVYLTDALTSHFKHISTFRNPSIKCELDFDDILSELKVTDLTFYNYIVNNLNNNQEIKNSNVDMLSGNSTFEKYGIKSILMIPIYYHDLLKGFVGFAECQKSRNWDDLTVSYLNTTVGYIAAFLKLREEKRSIEEDQKKAKAIINATTDAVAMFDINGILTEVNDEFARRFNKKPKELVGRNSIELFPPDVARRRKEFVSNVFKTGEPASTEDYRDGVWNDYRVYPIKDEQNRIFHAVVFARNITKNRESQEKLKLYNQIYNFSKDPVAIVAPDGTYIDRNNAHRMLFGYSDDYLFSKTPALFIGKDKFEEVYSSLLSNGEYSGEVLFKKNTGDIIHIELSAFSIKDSDNNPVCYVGIQRDITDRKEIELEKSINLEKLRNLLDETVAAITSVVEVRDRYTAGHQKKVSMLASAIALEMGLPKDQFEGIKMAAMLHDIGKVYVPSEILTKPGKLEKIEFELIKLHVNKGYEILKTISFPWNVADIVNQHHERLNGAGYPNGLKGDEILLGAKIVAVSDVIDAMTSTRPYRSAIGLEVALNEIIENRNTLYDPDIVDICVDLLRSNKVNLFDDSNLL